jgi:uncharacterized protein YfaS (alpha-2-macroglobulin family)
MQASVWRCVFGFSALLLTTGATGSELRLVSAAPQGVLEGVEQQRLQLVFSAPVVPLGEVTAMSTPPGWLQLTPPILARWRWAGTTELIGEPLAPLLRATVYTVRIEQGLRAVDGSALSKTYSFTFTTPLPHVRIELAEQDEDSDSGPSESFAIALVANQPIDAGRLREALRVTIAPRPLEGASSLLPAERVAELSAHQPEAAVAWDRFVRASRGATAQPAIFTLEADRETPHQRLLIRPIGCWPAAATVEVAIAAGVPSLEGKEVSPEVSKASFATPWPFAPLHFVGRAQKPGPGFDPEGVQLELSSPASLDDVAPYLRYRLVGSDSWKHLPTDRDEWYWTEADTTLRLWPLGLGGGQQVELCLDAEVRDALGRELGFPWCGVVTTAHTSPRFYLLEDDGVVEWTGPHRLPLRTMNVRSYRIRQQRLEENELVATLGRRRSEGEKPREATLVELGGRAEVAQTTPIELDAALGGRPGIVLTELWVEELEPNSEYGEHDGRWLRQVRSTLTQVTDLGLTVKSSKHEGLLVWVTRLADTKPQAGAEVVVRDKQNSVLWRGSTDERGLVRTPPEISLDKAFVVSARLGEDLAYARTVWYEGHQGWEFNLPVDYGNQAPVDGEVWPDRGIVRPGESLHIKAVIRRREDRRLRLLEASSVTFLIRDSRDQDVLRAEAKLDGAGSAETEVKVPAGAALGRWTITVGERYDEQEHCFCGEGQWSIEGGFRVAEFRRPKFRVSVAADSVRLIAGDRLSARVEGRLLSGGAMAGAQGRWTLRAVREPWQPGGTHWNGWRFVPELPSEQEEESIGEKSVATGAGTLDGKGLLPIELARVEALGGWPARVSVEGEVVDLDHQSSAARAVVLVLPGEVLLGIKRPASFVQASAGVDASVVAITPDGTPVAGVGTRVQLVRRHWESVRRREVSGRYVFESREVSTTIAEQEVTTGSEPVGVHFDLAESGEYVLVVRGKDRRGNQLAAATWVYVFGVGFTPWRMDQENRIELVPERDRYVAGERARILVKSPWERATALITVEKAGVLEARVEQLVGTMPTIEVPLDVEHIPNSFVSVVLLRGRIEIPADPEMIDPGRPAYRVGYCELTVPPQGRKLDVTVATQKPSYRPGQSATATLRVTGEDGRPRRASVTLWAVDAGVLELTGYRAPDLMKTFYARRGLGICTAESRSRLIGRRSYGTKGDKPGGGGGREAADAEVRRDFRALALWRGDLVTDEQGRATVTFPLPDSLTTYRLMAVALAGSEEFGSGEAEMLVSKPLGLEPALPRFLRPEDKARAGIVVRNRTTSAQQVEVTLALPTDGAVHLRGTPTRVVSVPAGGSAEVGFGLLGAAPGDATLRFSAVSVGESPERDAFEIALPVIATMPSETVATFFTTAERSTDAVAVPQDVFSTVGGLELRLASSPLVQATPAVTWLAEYEHLCAEQLASQVIGLTAAGRLAEGLAPARVGGVARAEWLAGAVERLLACQRSDGGFAFWPDASTSAPELAAFAVWALVEARGAGVAVDDAALSKAREYLSQSLRAEPRPGMESHSWSRSLLALHALGRLGKPEPAYYQALFDARKRHGSGWGRALLAATIAASNSDDKRSGMLLQEVRNILAVEARTAQLVEPAPEWGWLVWWSDTRGSAVALLALLANDPQDPLTDRLARGLLDRLGRGRVRTTHDTAWALHALSRYYFARGGEGGARTATATLGGERVLTAELSGKAPEERQMRLAMAELQQRAARATGQMLPLVVEVRGTGEVHGVALLAYASKRSDRPPMRQGIALQRRFLDRRKQSVGGAQAGEEVTLEIAVDCPAVRRFIAVEVPLPAGLEAIDPELATTAQRDEDEASEENDEEDSEEVFWRPGFDHVEMRDDRVVLYATELPTGTTITTVRCRATVPGSYLVAPGRAEAMYAPEVLATTPAGTFDVFLAGR